MRNAGRFLEEAEVDAIKLDGGGRVTPQVSAIVDAGIVVRGGTFPAEEYCYRMVEGEFPRFQEMAKKYAKPARRP